MENILSTTNMKLLRIFLQRFSASNLNCDFEIAKDLAVVVCSLFSGKFTTLDSFSENFYPVDEQ